MIITFCGHSGFIGTKEHEQKVLDILEESVREDTAEMYLGGYGGFDEFAYHCCKMFKEKHQNTKLVFVTPYITSDYQKNHLENLKSLYDYIIYPTIEDKPKRFAIIYRNRYMVDSADLLISYIEHNYGGAYQTYRYAKRKKKRICNLGRL